eukprot:EG_transcript_15324
MCSVLIPAALDPITPAESSSVTGTLRPHIWLPFPDRNQVTNAWQSTGFGPVLRVSADSRDNTRWLIRKFETVVAVEEGSMECSFSRYPTTYDLQEGDELVIPACRMHRFTFTSPCTYFMAYKTTEDDDETRAKLSTSYYTYSNRKALSPRARVDLSPRAAAAGVARSLVSKQEYVTPMSSVDTDVLTKELSESVDSNPKLRRKRLLVTVVEGRDLPSGTDSLYRVNLFYKDQVASTRTKLEPHHATWNDSFIFEGHDNFLVVELQGIDRTRLNLNDLYDALLDCTDVVTVWVRVPLLADKPLEECSRIKLELQADFNPRRDSTPEMKQLLSQKPLAKSMAAADRPPADRPPLPLAPTSPGGARRADRDAAPPASPSSA